MELGLPIKGYSEGISSDKVPPLTSEFMLNIRPIDVLNRKLRIGQRPGLDKWGVGTQIGGAEQPVVALCIVGTIK